ncbi:MAG TPA: tRNA 5-methoxyuridine(34)/uridine 5-oxyacetic acid(34) synthase CmoB, partial [Spirochaetota bacterium]|nr:tRNA 5-methoxyuridine(34)/uridine 5-oxyacetic acid(34) synthase CmoB [Spirochaetota bacterium]
FGIDIDSEWRSDLKWNIISSHCGSLKDKKILDIGCNNGYYLFRMSAHKPEIVLGIDPVKQCCQQFGLLKNLIKEDLPLYYALWGHEKVCCFKKFFDVIFCLGIVYHTTDPVKLLQNIHKALSPSGRVIIESQGIPGRQSIALFPRRRYAQARGMWFLPTPTCLKHWCERAGFTNINIFHTHKLSAREQRATAWAPRCSFTSALEKKNENLTVEGYPAPIRIYLCASKN